VKVIGRSNFDDETVSDILMHDNLSEAKATDLAINLNGRNLYARYNYIVVPDNYKLYRFQP